MTRLIIAPADQVTGLEFMDRVTGSSPAKRAKRDEHSRIMASGDAEAIEAYRQRCLEEAFEAVWAKADALRLTKTKVTEQGDGWFRVEEAA